MVEQGGSRQVVFRLGNWVNVLCFGRGKWISGVAENILGPVTFQVKLEDGKLVKCHANQLQHKYDTDCPVRETASPGEGQGNDQIDPKDLLPSINTTAFEFRQRR